MTIYFLSPHNKPSGGTKVVNQFVNLCNEKKVKSFLVVDESISYQASFLTNPASTISLEIFKKKCKANDIVICIWQNKNIHRSIINCPACLKIFWHHGTAIPTYPNFNGEEVYTSMAYDQYWNVSHACAKFIEQKYNIKKISILSPFFDDKTLLTVKKNNINRKRNGILLLRRRGQEIIPHIINKFPNVKITILNQFFTDKDIYEALCTHQFFISTDNGVSNGKLYPKTILNQDNSLLQKIMNFKKRLTKSQNKIKRYNTWLPHTTKFLGFPMTACEAAWLHTPVIGFAMGGGLEWMNPQTCFLAEDFNADSLLEKIEIAINTPKTQIDKIVNSAYKNVKKFNKEATWKKFVKLLSI